MFFYTWFMGSSTLNNGNLSRSKIWCRVLYVRLGDRYVGYVALLLVVVDTPYTVCKIASCITRWKGKIQPSCSMSLTMTSFYGKELQLLATDVSNSKCLSAPYHHWKQKESFAVAPSLSRCSRNLAGILVLTAVQSVCNLMAHAKQTIGDVFVAMVVQAKD